MNFGTGVTVQGTQCSVRKMQYSRVPAQSQDGVVGDRQKKSGILTYNDPLSRQKAANLTIIRYPRLYQSSFRAWKGIIGNV